MIIKNGLVFEEDMSFSNRDVFIENHKIVENIEQVTDRTEIDATGLYVIPGLIDVHSHGACGCDFSDADIDGLRTILKYQRSKGITSYCPTSMTLPKERLLNIFSTVSEVGKDSELAHIAGINMEGPFLDAPKKGAHVEDNIIPPDVSFFRECNARCNQLIKLVTLAPNAEGALSFIQELHKETNISLGHTSAGYTVSKAAFDAGANHVTHLYNAMMPFGHRDPALIGAAAESNHCMVELICDGIHIHESMVRATFQLFKNRVVLISDSMRATGMENGTYDLGGQQVTVVGKLATLKDGTIAGSATNLYDCMRTAISFGIPKGEAIAAATMNPAKSIGIFDVAGSLTTGKRGDMLLVDGDMNLKQVIS